MNLLSHSNASAVPKWASDPAKARHALARRILASPVATAYPRGSGCSACVSQDEICTVTTGYVKCACCTAKGKRRDQCELPSSAPVSALALSAPITGETSATPCLDQASLTTIAESDVNFHVLGDLSLPDPAAFGLEKAHQDLAYSLRPLLAELDTRDMTGSFSIQNPLITILIRQQ